LEVLEQEKLTLEQSISQVKQNLAQKTTQIEQLVSLISNLEERVCLQGGQWIEDRNNLMIEKEKLLSEVSVVQNEIRELCAGLFPFTIVPELCNSLKIQLESEEQFQKQHALSKEINNLLEKGRLRSRKLLKKFPQIPKSAWEECVEIFVNILSSSSSKEQTEVNVIHDFSFSEKSEIISWVNQVSSSVPKRMRELSVRLEKSTRELQVVESKLQRVPPEESIRPLIEEISISNKQLGGLQNEASQIEKERNSLDSQLEDIKRTIQRLYESIDKNENMEERLLLSSKVQMILRGFVQDVKARKVQDLENCFSFAFNKLARKGDLVKTIKIDAETFSVSLFNQRGREIPRKDLSAGEKQIYAISMLWALGQISGRPLPVVIDTPLGRLDSDHRTHIVENYFPKASHQVVLLSTDTEIERSYFKFLGPYISHAYQLEYDSSEGTTKLQEGYFWSTKETVVAS
jgi:DNA sulfur modification protein DndD